MNELNELRQSLTSDITSNVQAEITNQLTSMLMAFVIPIFIIGILIAAFYIIRTVRRYKVDKAIFEIRDTLREMKASQATIEPMSRSEPADDQKAAPSQTG